MTYLRLTAVVSCHTHLCKDGLQYEGCDSLPVWLGLCQFLVILHQSTVPLQVVSSAVLEEEEREGSEEKKMGKKEEKEEGGKRKVSWKGEKEERGKEEDEEMEKGEKEEEVGGGGEVIACTCDSVHMPHHWSPYCSSL